MGCTLTQPGEYERTVHERWQCSLFVKLVSTFVYLFILTQGSATRQNCECTPEHAGLNNNQTVRSPNVKRMAALSREDTQRKVWLAPTARVPCSNTANIGARKSWTRSEFCTWQNFVRAQEPPKMYIYSVPDGQISHKVWLTSTERRQCSNIAKTRNPLKFVGVPKTRQPISTVGGQKFTIL